MFNYWFLLFFIIGTIGLILLVKKSIRKGVLNEQEKTEEEVKASKVKIDLDKVEAQTKKMLEKFLRRCRIIILRLDNTVTKVLKNLKKETEEKKSFNVSSLSDYDFAKEEETVSMLEISYIDSIKNNPTIEGCLKLAEIYKNKEDFNTCHALLFKAWEIDKDDEKLQKVLKEYYAKGTSKK